MPGRLKGEGVCKGHGGPLQKERLVWCVLHCPSWVSCKTLHFCVISVKNSVPAKLLPITLIYPNVCDSMSLLEEVLQYSAYLQVKDLIGWTSPSCFDLSMTCLKAGVADCITSEHILKRTAMLDIYFSLAWEIQLIQFNQSPTGCFKHRGIWDIAVMNCPLFSEHAMQFRRAGSDGNTVSFSEKKS